MKEETHLDLATARALVRASLAEQRPGAPHGLGSLAPVDKARRAQVFCAARPDERIVVKVYAPASADKARAQVARQRAVVTALPDAAPEVLFFDESRLVLGMAYADGPSLSALWPHLSEADRASRLQAAGHWLRRLHGTSLEPHPFRPKGQLAWLQKLIMQHEFGGRLIPDVGQFRLEVAALAEQVPEVRGTPSVRAVTHRDLHLSNLMLTSNRLIGLDFENDAPDEPMRDLVALLLDAVAHGGGLEALSEALGEGYGSTGSIGPATLFLQRLFALGVWATTPPAPSLRQRARFVAAQRILAARAPLLPV
ncbi:MAG: aminoglycoside phosphotransferase family protein [Rhodobacteraceae bacterium]|nr:aminoglycoside phosphotransferase family protein [Paracoccaceae bacterium]